MKIGIIGSGLAGLGAAYHAKKFGSVTVLSYGQGASRIATGLMHPFVGFQSKLNYRGKEGFLASLALIKWAQLATAQPIILQQGLLRVAVNEKLKHNFQRLAASEKKVHWLDEVPGIYIEEAVAIDTPLYLKALQQRLKQEGVVFVEQEIHDLNLKYDKIILATGSHTPFVTPVKGQLLVLNQTFDKVLNGRAYLVPKQNKTLLGATFEHNFLDDKPNAETAKRLLLPKYQELTKVPWQVEQVLAGVRASTPNHLPLVRHWKENIYLFSGLGSKGLLYHSIYGKDVTNLLQHTKLK